MSGGVRVVEVALTDPLFAPVAAALAAEYGGRYGASGTRFVADEDARAPAAFEAPDGLLVVLSEHDTAVASAGFKRLDADTAEVKRVWTAATHRRRGLSRILMAEVEKRARAVGYSSLFLTTGPRQPEAVSFYLATGWIPEFDPDDPPEGAHAFWKAL